MDEHSFFARLGDRADGGQPLCEHLLKTAGRAAKYGAAFDAEPAAWFCGLIHDLGKYSDSFQKVLIGEAHHVDHAGAGALLQRNAYGGRGHVNAIGRAVFAHHSQLEYAIDRYLEESISDPDAAPLNPRKRRYAIRSTEAFAAACALWKRELGANIPAERPRVPAFRQDRMPALSEMLYTRFLLSCLADADYSDAAAYETGNDAHEREAALEPERLFGRLEAHLSELRARSGANPAINRLRDRVFDDCRRAADAPAGLFTLTAPTGLGKTLSMLAFALLHAKRNGQRRIIFVLPYLSILEQNAAEYRRIEPALLEDHSQIDLSDEQRIFAERYAAPVIVTTSVRFFESLFQCRATNCRRLHNIAKSVILFDEAQSLPAGLTAATLETMRELCARYRCSVVFSTATQPSFDARPDVVWQPTEIIRDTKALFEQTRRCAVSWETGRRTATAAIAARMKDEANCCAIVNTKAQARALYRALEDARAGDDCFYLSTDLCPEHRRAVIRAIRLRQAAGLPCRVVSTQCIEAGVDISFELMFRALAPLPSIVQSAGRVNRDGAARTGRLVVWLPEGTALYPDPSYENAALAVLTLLARHGGSIDLQNLSQLREYYEVLYLDPRHNRDLPELTRAIGEYDFARVAQTYRLIPGYGVNVIVPYRECGDLFRRVRAQALEEGVTPALMKLAAPITVRSVGAAQAERMCVRLNYPPRGRDRYTEASDWYFTDGEVGLYDAQTGLCLAEQTQMNMKY